ncbi:MAG: YdhR family protein [Methanotrichaceae archaeon]|nr:YdhR family protein [Methanotrichaceae archaeon]
MVHEKKALWVAFKPKKPENVAEMRKKFLGSYPFFKEMRGLFSKVWWCNPEKGEWGAMYIFDSEAELNEYLQSDFWMNKVPEKYGYKPEVVAILDLGPILYKRIVNKGENSWLSEKKEAN